MKCEKILVPVDGSEGGWKALDYAKELAEKFNAKILVMTVLQPFTNASLLALPVDSSAHSEELNEVGRKILATAQERVGALEGEFWLEVGRPSKMVVTAAKIKGVDLVVIGSRGLSGFAEFFLGSVSSEVAQLCPVPVLIVK